MKIVVLTGSETRHVYFRKKLASDNRITVLASYCESNEKSLASRNNENAQTSQIEIQHVEARTQSEIDFFSDYIENYEDKSNPKCIHCTRLVKRIAAYPYSFIRLSIAECNAIFARITGAL